MSKAVWLPAEWYPQSGVMLTWPRPGGDWAPWLDQVDPVFVAIAREVTQCEALLVSAYDEAHRAHILGLLQAEGVDLARVDLRIMPSDDSWARDHGPITVLDHGSPRLLDFGFNGWGNKFSAELDNTLSRRLQSAGAFGACPLQTLDLILEGGSIESDGQGTLLTTQECLLSPERNPQFELVEIEAQLRQLFGVERVLWLTEGALEGDDTDGHIDTLARFCDPHTIAHVVCDDPSDPHHAPLQAMRAQLRAMRDYQGNPYRLIELPLPAPIHSAEGQRLPATYANFLIINGAVLLPTYRDPLDALAVERLQAVFPAHRVVAIDCRPLVEQYGSLHCVTMQLPQGVLPHN